MRVRLVRALLILAGALVAVLLFGLSRLAAGPIRLPFLDRPIAAALERLAPDLVAEIGATALARSGRWAALSVSGVRLTARDGTVLLSLPELRVRPSFGALLRGRMVIARVDVAGAELQLTRRPDGTWIVGAGGNGAGAQVARVLGGAGTASGSAPLPLIALTHTRLTIDDERAGGHFMVGDGELLLRPSADRVEAAVAGMLDLVGTSPPLRGRAHLPIRADVTAVVVRDGALGDVRFTISGAAGELRLGDGAATPFALADLTVAGTYFPAVETVHLTRLVGVVGSSRVDAKATVILGAAPVLALEGTVDALALAELVRLWPATLAPAVRKWLAASVRAGELQRCRVRLGSPVPPSDAAGAPSAADATPNAFDVACDFTGVTADYLAPLDPVRAATGTVRLTPARLDVQVRAGAIGACRLDGGKLVMNLTVDPPRAEIAVDVSGRTADVLAVVERPPIAFVPPLGIAAQDVGGESRVHAELHLPITARLAPAAVRVQATAALSSASLPPHAVGVGLRDGRLDVRIDGATVAVQGTTALTGLPALTTPVTLALTIAPSKGDGVRRAALALDGDDVLVRGNATFSAAGLTTLAVERLRVGASDLAVTLRRRAGGDYEASLTGASLDLARVLADRPLGAGDGAALAADYTVSLRLGRVEVARDLEVRALHGSVQVSGGQIGAVTLGGALAPSGDFQATLAAGPGPRRLRVTSGEAGRLLRAVAGLQQIVGGTLALDATTDERGPFAALDGEVVLSDFKVVRAPVLSKILGVGSLGGIAALLQGEGLPISEARFPFQWDGSRITLHDVRAIGAVGITADGTIDRTGGTCDVRGDVIPAYSLNSALGKVPLLGKLFVGSKGNGVFGIDYHVSGALADPAVRVNPLTSVAPTVLRQWFVDPFVRAGAGRGSRRPSP